MPLPLPSKDEKEKDFIDKCMDDAVMKNDYPDLKQRSAVCYSQWDKSKKAEKPMFRADISRGIKEKQGVDREKEIIFGFSVVSKGEAKGHVLEVDDITLAQVIELGNKTKIGIKSRFGHPGMSSSAIGTFLGRARNFWLDGDRVRADLHIDKTAHNTPNGDLAKYVMDLAESDPDAFGASIVFEGKKEYRLNNDGSRKKSEAGKELLPLIRIIKFWGVDTVDDPATNVGMFGAFFTESVQLSEKWTEFFDKFLSHPDAVEKAIQFLQRYQVNMESEKVRCQNCNSLIDYEKEPEVAMGAIDCPKCKATIDQEGKVLKKPKQKEESKMDVKELMLETLKSERKDLVEAIEVEAGKKAAGLERNRVNYILMELGSFAAGLEGEPKKAFEAIAKDSIENGDKEEVALGKFKDEQIKQLRANAPKSTGANADVEKSKKSHLEKAQEYQNEHKCSMTDALKATAEPRKKS